ARLVALLEEANRGGKAWAVSLGPCGVRSFGFPPREGNSQFGVAVQAGFRLIVQISAFRQTMIDASRLRLFFDPLPQARPDPPQAFVGNVDDRLIGQLDLGRWHQEGDTPLPVGVDNRPQLFGWDLQNLAQSTEPLRTANSAVVRFLDRQRLENALAQFALVVA